MQNAENTRDSSLCTVLSALRQLQLHLLDQRLRYAFLRRADGNPVHLRMLASAIHIERGQKAHLPLIVRLQP